MSEEKAGEDRTYRRGFVTKHQVTGWRFLMRRIASGVALHDARMLVDPLRTQTRGVMMGALIVVTGLLGCLIFSWIRPGGDIGNSVVLTDRDSSALYVRVNDQVHPVLNLTSARLIAGQPVKPTAVRSAKLDQLARGTLVGIPGAPERMVQNSSRNAQWTVCDGNQDAGSAAGVTVIGGALDFDGERAAPLAPDHAVLVAGPAGTWLLWEGRRSAIDLRDQAVTGALGLGTNIPAAQPISVGLFNTIPEGAPLRAPVIAGAGEPTSYTLSTPAPVGSVVVAYASDNSMQHYAVLNDGLQQVSPVLAALLRNHDSHGLAQAPRLDPDEIAKLPVSHQLNTEAFPAQRITLTDAAAAPITCLRWTKAADAATSESALLSGAVLPIDEDARPVALPPSTTGTASRVVLPVGSGYFTQTVGQEPASPLEGSFFWVGDTGTRYGIEGANPDELAKTIVALGLSLPATSVPWSVLSLFAPGPALSKADALTSYTETENR